MRKLILIASAAAMAVSMPALGQGQGKGHGKGHQAESRGGQQQARGGGQRRAERGRDARPERGARAERARGNGRGHGRPEARADRGRGNSPDRQAQRAERRIDRDARREDRGQVREARRNEDRDWGGWSRRERGGDRHFGDRFAYWRDGRPLPVSTARGDCPPGLAKQNAFCLPPGQLRRANMIGQRVSRDRFRPVPDDWLYRFRDESDFYYLYDDDGFIYRVARETNFVSTIIPLFASNLLVGQPLPIGYDTYNLPVPYRDHYIDDDEYLYRYDDGAIYRVDNETRLIDSVVALLSGNPISVGSALPTGYDVYNVPFDYRARYADDDDSMYRYSNGAIYQVDPTTRLVQALVEMIV